MAAVVRQFQPRDQRVLGAEGGDELPGAVFAPVVHEQHAALFPGQARLLHLLQLCRQAFDGLREHLLFIVAGHHQIDRRDMRLWILMHGLFLLLSPRRPGQRKDQAKGRNNHADGGGAGDGKNEGNPK